MRRSPYKWLHLLWIVLLGLVSACQMQPTAQPSEAVPAPTRTLPPPAQTHTVRSAATQTPTPLPSATPTQASSLLGVEPGELRGLTVQFWHPLSGKADATLRQFIAAFNQENPWGISVQPIGHAGIGALDEQVRLAQEEGRLDGLIAAYSDQARRWEAQASFVADLTLYLNDPLYGLSDAEQQDFYPGFWRHDLVRQGTESQVSKRLGVPWYRSALMLFYNRTWAEELGFRTFPDTPEQFRTQVCAAAQANQSDQEPQNNGTGGWLITEDPLQLVGWIHTFGGEIENQAGNAFSFFSPAAEQAVQSLANLTAEGCAWSSAEERAETAFANRRALVWMGRLANLTAQQEAFGEAANQDLWVVLPLPSINANQTIEAYGPGLVVVKSTPAQELAAWLFTRWLLSAENQAAWAEANGVFPVRTSALQQARTGSGQAAQWAQALVWLPRARSEPRQPAWGAVRGLMADALAEVLAPGFQHDQVGALLNKLDQISAEIQANFEK